MPEIEAERYAAASNHPNALLGKYELGRLLGCGAFAKVYHARNLLSGQSVAIKVINKKKLSSASSSTMMSNIKREISIMRRLHHRHIVQLHEVMATKSKIYFVMELVKGGELFAKVAKGRFPEDLSRKYFHQLISAVGYCHSRGVFHRDLKPENLLVDENGNLKVSDFGLSALTDHIKPDGLLHTLCGTPAYVAPEILTKKGYDGAKVDVWSCGVILFVLNAGYLPFNDPNLMAMYKKIYKGEFKCPKWMSPELKRFLQRLLDTNPDTRITIHEILKDPWFKKGYKAFQTDETAFTDNMYRDYYYHCCSYSDNSSSSSNNSSGCGSNTNSKDSDGDVVLHKSIGELNAFDIISFSAGLDLSGLFVVDDLDPRSLVEDRERLLSKAGAEEVMQKVEEFAKEDKLRVRVMKGGNKKEWGVHLEGENGKLGMEVGVQRLTENLVVVEVRRGGGDALVYRDVWKNKLKPRLGLFQKIKDAIKMHNTARCSIGATNGVGNLAFGPAALLKDNAAV